jgi:hypothetical protein
MGTKEEYDRQKTEKDAATEHPYTYKILGWWKNIGNKIAVIALVSNIVLAAGTVGLVWVTHNLVTGADTQSRRQLRAYVGVIPDGIENFGDRKTQSFKLTRKNYGATPAYDVWIDPRQTIIHIGDTIQPIPITPPNITGTFTIFPSAELPYYSNGINATDKQIALVREAGSEFQIAYYGIIYYRDAFGEPHYTHYCWLFSGPSMTAKEANGCLGHNDSN